MMSPRYCGAKVVCFPAALADTVKLLATAAKVDCFPAALADTVKLLATAIPTAVNDSPTSAAGGR